MLPLACHHIQEDLHLDRIVKAGDAAEELLRDLARADVAKALDPTNPSDFLVIVSRLARALASVSREQEAVALRTALKVLDVDWRTLSAAGRESVLVAARTAVTWHAGVARVVAPVFGSQAERLVFGTRTIMRMTLPGEIAVDLTAADLTTASWLARSSTLFVSDTYRQREASMSTTARSVVADGLARGAGRGEIAADLERALGPAAQLAKSRNYWEVVAASFANRARTYGVLSSMREAGIENYRFVAVLDEVTTDVCRYMDGTVFPVQSGLDVFSAMEAAGDSADGIRDAAPWVRTGRDTSGDRVLYVQRSDGTRVTMAQVSESGVGTRDARGTITGLSPQGITALGANIPPLHGLCRSTVVAEV